MASLCREKSRSECAESFPPLGIVRAIATMKYASSSPSRYGSRACSRGIFSLTSHSDFIPLAKGDSQCFRCVASGDSGDNAMFKTVP